MQFCVLFFFYRGFADSILECKECDSNQRVHPECLPIPVPKGDPFYPPINITTGRPFCLAFTRSMPGQLTLGEIYVKSLFLQLRGNWINVYLLNLDSANMLRGKLSFRIRKSHFRSGPFFETFFGTFFGTPFGAPSFFGTFGGHLFTYVLFLFVSFLGFREQMNQITSFSDASNVYGSDLCEMRELRVFHGGKLNSTRYIFFPNQNYFPNEVAILPI